MEKEVSEIDRSHERKVCRQACKSMVSDPIVRIKITDPEKVFLECFKACRTVSEKVDKIKLPEGEERRFP